MEFTKVKIEVYLPEETIAPLAEALAEAGAGRVGLYDQVTAYAPSWGTWRPLAGSSPHAGDIGRLCHGEEFKLEVRCPAEAVPAAIAAIRRVHPYEEPLINILPLLNGWYGVE